MATITVELDTADQEEVDSLIEIIDLVLQRSNYSSIITSTNN